MISATKVPALSLSLALAFSIAACGGETESDSDSDRSPYGSGDLVEERAGTEAPPAQPAPDPDPAPPATSGQQSPPPVQDTSDPVVEPPVDQTPPVTDSVEGDWEELETPINALPVGTMIAASLSEDVSTRTHSQGDSFSAVVTEDLRAEGGQVLVPAGTEIRGHVASARSSTDSDEESILVLAFDALVLDGVELPFRATVLDANVSGDAGASGTRSAATVATGAAAGAILGQILGRDTRSTVAGAAVGAVAGAGIALSTRDGHAEAAEGTTLQLQLDEPLVVTRVR